jgi:hypothetical protein
MQLAPTRTTGSARRISRSHWVAATEAGYRSYITNGVGISWPAQGAHVEGNSAARMRAFTGPSVLVLDELG